MHADIKEIMLDDIMKICSHEDEINATETQLREHQKDVNNSSAIKKKNSS